MSSFRCFVVRRPGDEVVQEFRQCTIDDLPDGEVLIKVKLSALNYKDGLAYKGHPGVALSLPLVPGIDAVGEVLESTNDRCAVGDSVMVTGADFGTRNWGGWSELARVPGDYCLRIPEGMSPREAVVLGTAGFTAAQSLEKLQHHGVNPHDGPVLVTGATGGVGSFAVKMLAQQGYEVVAVTGKKDKHSWLKNLGAAEIAGRETLADDTNRPLLSGKWAGAIDTVGGKPLETILRSTRPGGCVTACGLVAGHELATTVYPFILRGVSLQGIDSANASVDYREHLWQRLANDLKVHQLDDFVTEIELSDVAQSAEAILAGNVFGRHIVRVAERD